MSHSSHLTSRNNSLGDQYRLPSRKRKVMGEERKGVPSRKNRANKGLAWEQMQLVELMVVAPFGGRKGSAKSNRRK